MDERVFITSDWHFMHNRDFIYGPRGFSSTQEMTTAIIERHNEIVRPQDHVYVLGDLMLNDNAAGLAAIKQLKGQIHVIRGNHDTDGRMDLYSNCYNVVEVVEGKYLVYKGYHFYLSHFPCLCGNFDESKPLKNRIVSLCGHTHTQDPFLDWDKGLIFHCEVDSNNCYPWNLDDIIAKIKEKV